MYGVWVSNRRSDIIDIMHIMDRVFVAAENNPHLPVENGVSFDLFELESSASDFSTSSVVFSHEKVVVVRKPTQVDVQETQLSFFFV